MKNKSTSKKLSLVRRQAATCLIVNRKKRQKSVLPILKNKTFEDFIANAKNAFPLALAKKVVDQKPEETYNPFILCGADGTGKTHLLETVAAEFAKKTKKIIFQSAVRFCTENTNILQRHDIFWKKYDVLILDDIQELVNNPSCQQLLATCIDACLRLPPDKNPQMVFACAGSVNEIKKLGERLCSRLERGLVVELMKPDLEVRLRYIQTLCKQHEITLGREQLLFLARRCAGFRLLYGLILKIKAFISVYDKTPAAADMENIIRSGGVNIPENYYSIMEKVAQAFNVLPEDIVHGKRRPNVVMARQTAMYICRRRLKLSYEELGRIFGGKDHSTVIYAVNKIKQLLISNESMHNMITQLEQVAL
ncbi:MAG: chromosomal replication initiator DnaA [Desulfovibrio sp.]|jgi:chromosomal replication initiator protein|nr:chromosomal replication initiator DnaA [Desulfovibrio sp.]